MKIILIQMNSSTFENHLSLDLPKLARKYDSFAQAATDLEALLKALVIRFVAIDYE